MASSGFAVFRSDRPQLPLQFEYPADWQLEPSSGSIERYTQVQLYGPKALEPRLRSYIVVRAIPPKTEGGRYADLSDAVRQYEDTLLPTLRITQRRQTTVLGANGQLLDVQGAMRLPWESRNAELVPTQSQRLFFAHDGLLYEIAWTATPEAAPAVQAAFEHLLGTLAKVS